MNINTDFSGANYGHFEYPPYTPYTNIPISYPTSSTGSLFTYTSVGQNDRLDELENKLNKLENDLETKLETKADEVALEASEALRLRAGGLDLKLDLLKNELKTEKPLKIEVKPRLNAGDTVYTKFHKSKGPFILLQPTSFVVDEDTGCSSGKLQRVAVSDAWTVQDEKGKTFALPAALLTKCPPPAKASWTSWIDLDIVNMSLLAILSALTSGCLTAGIYMLVNS